MIDNTNIAMGFDDELLKEEVKTAPPKAEVMKQKRAPYAVWEVGGEEYKLRLTAVEIAKLEQKYKRNLLLYLTDDGIPAIADMLTVIQAAMRSYHHGTTFLTVQSLFDTFVDEGGDQNKLMTDVLMPLLAVSGFFTQSQAEMLTQEIRDASSNL